MDDKPGEELVNLLQGELCMERDFLREWVQFEFGPRETVRPVGVGRYLRDGFTTLQRFQQPCWSNFQLLEGSWRGVLGR